MMTTHKIEGDVDDPEGVMAQAPLCAPSRIAPGQSILREWSQPDLEVYPNGRVRVGRLATLDPTAPRLLVGVTGSGRTERERASGILDGILWLPENALAGREQLTTLLERDLGVQHPGYELPDPQRWLAEEQRARVLTVVDHLQSHLRSAVLKRVVASPFHIGLLPLYLVLERFPAFAILLNKHPQLAWLVSRRLFVEGILETVNARELAAYLEAGTDVLQGSLRLPTGAGTLGQLQRIPQERLPLLAETLETKNRRLMPGDLNAWLRLSPERLNTALRNEEVDESEKRPPKNQQPTTPAPALST